MTMAPKNYRICQCLLYDNFKEMARETVTAVLIQQQQQQIALTQMTFYHKMAYRYKSGLIFQELRISMK
jgi:hypothetical protein